MKCFVCEDDTVVLQAAGLKVADLFDEPRAGRTGSAGERSTNGLVSFDQPGGSSRGQRGRGKRGSKATNAGRTASSTTATTDSGKLTNRLVQSYFYPDAQGNKHGKVCRFDVFDEGGSRVDKTFRTYQWNVETSRWVKGGFDALYRAPEVAAAIAAGELVWVFEGEKDADRAADLGLAATTNAGGAGSFAAKHARQLAGARVVLVLDRDTAGYHRGLRLNNLLFADPEYAVAELRIVEPVAGKDFTDHADTGHAIDELVDVVDPRPRFVACAIDDAREYVAAEKPSKARSSLAKAGEVLVELPQGGDREQLVTAHTDVTEPVLAQLSPGPARDQLADLQSALAGNGQQDELARKRRQRLHSEPVDHGGEGDDADPPEPKWEIPTSSGSWAYSTGDDGDLLERGVYRAQGGSWLRVAPLPHVLQRLIRRNGQGGKVGASYRLATRPLDDAADVAICSDDEIKTGEWATKLDVPLSADDKIMKAVTTAIRQIAAELEPREITPGWVDGSLVMPPWDVLGGGWGEIACSEDQARRVWRDIATVAVDSPKVVLAMGASLAGVLVRPLLKPYRSFWLQMVGHGQHGKTTALNLASALFGNPETLVETFDASGKGLTYRFGELACLPMYLDEIGAGELENPKSRERMILSVGEGGRRRIATREQRSKTSPPWHGTIVCSGNDNLTSNIRNEAVYARVIELPAPITASPDNCDQLENLLEEGAHGWPIRWLMQDLDLDRVRASLQTIEQDLPLPSGGISRTAGRNLALVVAAAAELDRLFGTSCLQPVAMNGAREALSQLIAEMAEHGASPATRLYNAIEQAVISRPTAFATRTQYRQAVQGGEPGDPFDKRVILAREVEGFHLADDDGVPGDLAIMYDRLPKIAAEAGIADTRPGLRELAAEGLLIRSGEADGKLLRRIPIGTVNGNRIRPYCYVFQLNPEIFDRDDDDEPTRDDPHDGETGTDEPEPPPRDPPPLSPVPDSVPGSTAPTGDNPIMPLTRTDDMPNGVSDPHVPVVPGSGHGVARNASPGEGGTSDEVLIHGTRGPVWLSSQRSRGACRACHDPAPTYDRDGWIHAMCSLQETAPPPPSEPEQDVEPKPEPAATDERDGHKAEASTVTTDRVTLTGPPPPRPTGFRAACVVYDPSGIYLPDGERHCGVQIRDALDALECGEWLRVGHPGGPGQLILTDAMCAELGLIAQADEGLAGDAAREQVRQRLGAFDNAFLQRARDAGWDIEPLRVENRARRGNRVLDIVLAPYEHLWTRGRETGHPLGALDPTESLSQEEYAAAGARLMGYLAHLLGGPWRSSAVQVGWDLFDRGQRSRSRRGGHVLTRPATLPQLTGDVTADSIVPQLTWSRWTPRRPATAHERGQLAELRYAVHLDRKAAWLASAAQSTLGYLTDDAPEMQHHQGPDAVAKLLARPEAIPTGLYRLLLPAAEHSEVPPLHGHQSPTEPRWIWVPAPIAAALLYDDDPSTNWVGLGCSVGELVGADGQSRAEAWTFPAQGRLLEGLWYDTLRQARYAVDRDNDEVAQDLIKRVYAGTLQTAQNTSRTVLEGPRAWRHQVTWLPTVKGHHYAWQNHLIRRAHYSGLIVASAQIDEVVLLVAEPEQAKLGTMKGYVGQYKQRLVRQLTDEHRNQLADGVPGHELKGGEVEQ